MTPKKLVQGPFLNLASKDTFFTHPGDIGNADAQNDSAWGLFSWALTLFSIQQCYELEITTLMIFLQPSPHLIRKFCKTVRYFQIQSAVSCCLGTFPPGTWLAFQLHCVYTALCSEMAFQGYVWQSPHLCMLNYISSCCLLFSLQKHCSPSPSLS